MCKSNKNASKLSSVKIIKYLAREARLQKGGGLRARGLGVGGADGLVHRRVHDDGQLGGHLKL